MAPQCSSARAAEVPHLNLPVRDYRRVHVPKPPGLLDGADQAVDGLVGLWRRRPGIARTFDLQARLVLDRMDKLSLVSDAQLTQLIDSLRATFRRQSRAVEESVTVSMACVAEVARRTLGLRPHPVQVMGALAMHAGFLIEMATGEGKSLTACLAAALAAWTGRPVHVVTVNDYLAARDAEEMAAFYRMCGTTAAAVVDSLEPGERQAAYEQGVVYTTSQQLLADFLRDRLAMGAIQDPTRRIIRQLLGKGGAAGSGLVLRGLDFALVDEADSVLIDEAVTPLIISAISENRPLIEASEVAVKIAYTLEPGVDYKVHTRYHEVRLTEAGKDKIEDAAAALGGVWRGSPRRTELVTQALVAREFYRRGKQYVVHAGKVIIVDEFTGRLMPDRHWSHGLHQAVEAKEGVEMTSPTETMARLSFQRFFRLFRRLCGMSGTVKEASAELWNIYRLPVVSIPTNRPCRRVQLPDSVHPDEQTKLSAIVDDVLARVDQGRPILIGTRSIYASEDLAQLLGDRGLHPNVLNATRHKEEAQIVAQAGQPGRVTIATNMAGRGTDIKLGHGVADMGGLHVIATERNESLRIDRQLFGRSARQGDPGSAQAYLCPEDELIRRFTPLTVQDSLIWACKHGLPGSSWLARSVMSKAQNTAQVIAYRQRREVLRVDEWLEEALSFSDQGGGYR